MMFVCVPKELALPLGPNQQPTAAGYEQNCFFVCFFLFSCFFFFFLRGAKQLMVCLWETSKLFCSGKHMYSDARWKRK